jgi:hypothetical protein
MSQHRKPDDAPKREGWLVCNTVGPGLVQGAGGYPCVIRGCRAEDCDSQVWVSMLHLGRIEAGQLWPRCWECQARSGRPVTMHPAEVDYLTSARRLTAGQRTIAEMNEWLEAGAGATDQPDDEQDGTDERHDHADYIGDSAQRVGEQAGEQDERDTHHQDDQGTNVKHGSLLG